MDYEESTNGCEGCLGNVSDDDCLEVTKRAQEEGFPDCSNKIIYVEGEPG